MSIILTEAGWMRTAYKLARRFGGKVVSAGRSKHPKIVGLNAAGKQIKMTIPSSPSDNARTAKNVEAQLRRAGFVDRSTTRPRHRRGNARLDRPVMRVYAENVHSRWRM